jgi:hypothetical protein
LVGRRRDLRPSPEFAHASLHRSPGFFPARLALFGAIDFELFGLVDGGFDPQDAAFLGPICFCVPSFGSRMARSTPIGVWSKTNGGTTGASRNVR